MGPAWNELRYVPRGAVNDGVGRWIVTTSDRGDENLSVLKIS